MVETTANIDAQIEWPEFVTIPDVTFAWIDEGLTEFDEFQRVSGLGVTLDGDVRLVITGGADGGLFEVSGDGMTLQAKQEFDVDAPVGSLFPNLLSIETALEDGDGNIFENIQTYILVRPEDRSDVPLHEFSANAIPGLLATVTRLSNVIDTILTSSDNDRSDSSYYEFHNVLFIVQTYIRALFFEGMPIGTWKFVEDVVSGNPELVAALTQLQDLLEIGFLSQDEGGGSNDVLLSPLDGGELPSGLGWDLFIGQSGNVSVLYDGVRDDFVHDLLGHNVVAVDKPSGETDLLLGIERVDFDDGSLVFSIDSDCVDFVYRMYEAAFDRAPGYDGLVFWTDAVDWLKSEQPWTDAKHFLADQFVASNEFQDRFGTNPAFTDYVDAMYEHVLDRDGPSDPDGRAFWIDGMNQGLGYDDILIAFTESDENVLKTAPDIDDGIWVV